MKKSKQSVPQIITSAIMKQLEEGVIPWQRPTEKPRNAHSGRFYTSLNQFLLGKSVAIFGDPRFLTFNEISSLGGSIFEGESGNIVFFSSNYNEKFKPDGFTEKCQNCLYCKEKICTFSDERYSWQLAMSIQDEQEHCADYEPKVSYVKRYYRVWNIMQTTLRDDPKFIGSVPPSIKQAAYAKDLISAMGKDGVQCLITHSKAPAHYDIDTDNIKIMARSKYKDENLFFYEIFKSLALSTGSEKRLNLAYLRTNEQFSYGMLAAEMTAAMLCMETGVRLDLEAESSYIGGWLELLKRDSRLVLMAGSSATRIYNYILSKNAHYNMPLAA